MEHNCNIHIGQLIREQLKADQRSASWLAREIGCSRNHVYKIFNKPSLDADLILKISIAMSFNFFQYYSAEVNAAMKARMGEEWSCILKCLNNSKNMPKTSEMSK